MSSIQIKNIFLWQKNGTLRDLEFKENHVNVITGDSGKGKSSVLYIIDYCLLSSEAKGISKTNIDSKVKWYGLRLKINDNIITIGRPSISSGLTDAFYYSDTGEIPEEPDNNIKLENLKNILNTAFGIDSDLKVPYGGKFVRAGSKVSFRSFLSHCYQDQTTIVSPDYLYIKPSDKKFQERVQRTFRMALGVENASTSLIKSRLVDLEQKKASLEKRKEHLEKKRTIFHQELSELAQEAVTVGALGSIPKEDSSLLSVLKEIAISADIPLRQESEVEVITKEIFSLKLKNRNYTKFIEAKNDYINQAKATEDSLKAIDIINLNQNHIFRSQNAASLVSHLQRELLNVRELIKNKKTAPFIGEVKEIIKENKKEIEKLEKDLEKFKSFEKFRATPKEYFKYIGKLEAKIDLYASDALPDELTDEDIDEKIKSLKSELEDDQSRADIAKRRLDQLINLRLEKLKLKGYEGFEALFIEPERIINLYSAENDAIEKMPDIGSASNYLYLHLSYFLALHEVAKERKTSWMPSFVVFDQPSTPYFTTSGTPTDDIKSLDAVFIELDSFVKKMDNHGGFQVILLEHVEESHWKNLDLQRFRLVDRELRDDYGLVLE
ncbi:TPA: DUF3732 domain-containing protein [Pseudomonas putida]|jgi:energy-coupling factor transporter ATP-binding protein EcfA2|nr:DUF3732 domain-containing protein [Pseudomonas putida]